MWPVAFLPLALPSLPPMNASHASRVISFDGPDMVFRRARRDSFGILVKPNNFSAFKKPFDDIPALLMSPANLLNAASGDLNIKITAALN